MNNEEIDILHHVERLTEHVNKLMASHSRSAIKRYPLTFTLVGLVGAIAVSEGVRGLLDEIPYIGEHPLDLLLIGLIILIVLGSLYKKLEAGRE